MTKRLTVSIEELHEICENSRRLATYRAMNEEPIQPGSLWEKILIPPRAYRHPCADVYDKQ